MQKDSLADLYRHMAWADAVVWKAVLAAPLAAGDDALLARFHHLHLVQHAFLNIWQGAPMDFPRRESFATAADLANWGREGIAAAELHVARAGEEQLEAIVDLPWSAQVTERLGKTPGPTTLGETVLQVAMHSFYHLGQVNMRLRELGVEPPLVDYIAWLWLGRPPAEWTL